MLEEHLSELRDEGQLDSEGFFTLDLSSRDRKSLDFYRAQSSFWQLKFVQLAVHGRASSLTMSCGQTAFKLRAAGIQHEGLPLQKGGPLEIIVQGCMAQRQEFSITQYGPSPWRLKIGSEGNLEKAAAPAVGRAPRLAIQGPGHGQASLGFWQRWFSRARETADWLKVMESRCRHLPIPMKIDGLSVQKPHPFGFRPLAVVKVDTSETLFRSDWQGSNQRRATCEFRVPDQPFQALIGIPDIPGGPTTIYILRAGIFLHAYRTDLGWPGSEVLLDCPAFKTDATTLQVIEDEAFLQTIRWLKSTICEFGAKAYHKAQADDSLDAGTLRAIRGCLAE